MHGGHTVHMSEWFRTHTLCPTGCGCKCIENSNGVYSVFQTPVTPWQPVYSPVPPKATSVAQQGTGPTVQIAATRSSVNGAPV